MEKLNGLIAAGFTPFKGGKINTEVIPTYAKYLVRSGVSGVFVNGTTGESLSLTVEERLLLAEAWTRSAPKELKVIIHVGHNSLPACEKMAAHAQEKGAWAVSAMAPTFFKPDLNGLVSYIAQVAVAAPDLPFYYYHMPSMTGASFLMTDFLKQADGLIPNLAGIKYTWEDLMDYSLTADYAGGKYDVVFGRDEILLCGLALGAKAAIGSTYNFAAPLYNAVRAAVAEKDFEKANELQLVSMKLIAACRAATPCDLSGIKALTGWRAGVDLGPLRAPISAIEADAARKLFETAEKIGGAYLSVKS
ncbi:MAG: dihydrodipicolinate synthase family protein [Kiritimatiellales bacterium]